MLHDTLPSTPQQNNSRMQVKTYSPSRAAAQCAAVVLILFIYSYPSLKARAEFGAARLPPVFAPDLSLYLNLSGLKTVSSGQVLNPYYLVPVPANGTAYLKFRLGPALFCAWNNLLGGRLSLSMFTWNLFWWGLLCVITLWLFDRFLPMGSWQIGIAGLGLLMLVNVGMAKPVLAAWIHLPSLFGFQGVAFPFMRAFSPQIPIPLLLSYLGLQMVALRGRSLYPWLGMGVLQLLALSTFPYATMVMAGLTFVSVSWHLLSPGPRGGWHIPFAYAAVCAIADGLFLKRGSMNIYASHSSLIHFQPQLLPHLVGGTWLILCLLIIATILSKTLPGNVKGPLVGLGVTTVLLMLGDAVVPATVLLLSSHAAYFAHTTAAMLLTFLISAALARSNSRSNRPVKVRTGVAIVLALLALNGIFSSLGTYRASLPSNWDQVEVERLLSSSQPADGELVIARSQSADDTCGWVAVLQRGPVLFCTDAETMLTPQQNHDIHRFRQALYLYFFGEDSGSLQRHLSEPNPAAFMYRLGFWAEAVSPSQEEQKEGLRGIQVDLLPLLVRVERHDPGASNFFHQFQRIIVIDDLRNPTFLQARLGSFLKLAGEQHLDHWVLFSYVPD